MARDTLLGFPSHTLPYRYRKYTTLSAVSNAPRLAGAVHCVHEQQIYHPRFWGKMRGTKRLSPPVDGALHSAPVQNGIHILLRSGDRSQAVGVH